jgi:hypothetical protein
MAFDADWHPTLIAKSLRCNTIGRMAHMILGTTKHAYCLVAERHVDIPVLELTQVPTQIEIAMRVFAVVTQVCIQTEKPLRLISAIPKQIIFLHTIQRLHPHYLSTHEGFDSRVGASTEETYQ